MSEISRTCIAVTESNVFADDLSINCIMDAMCNFTGLRTESETSFVTVYSILYRDILTGNVVTYTEDGNSTVSIFYCCVSYRVM